MNKHYILYFILHYMIKSSFGSFCDTTEPVKHAFNVGYNVYIDNKWFYDVVNKKLIDNKYEALTLFGNNVDFRFQSIKTGFSLIFDDDCMKDERGIFCDTINSVKNVVIVIGMIDDKPGYGCFNYSKTIGDLRPLEDIDLPWGLQTSGILDKNFIKMPKNLFNENEAYYESMVLIPKRRQLLALIFDGPVHRRLHRHYVFTKKLEESGKWSDWRRVMQFTCNMGLFHIDNRVFGVNDENQIYELLFNDNNIVINLKKLSKIKEFFNCSNSLIPSELPLPSTPLKSQSTKSTTKVISESTTNAKVIITNTTPILISETDNKDMIITMKTSAKTTKQTAKILVTNTEPNKSHKSKTLSLIIILVVLILLIVLILASVILIIFWQKTKRLSSRRFKLKS